MQDRLLRLEHSVDPAFCFVARPMDGHLKWEHVMALWPRGFPTRDVWMRLCTDLLGECDGHARVLRLSKIIYKMRMEEGVTFDRRFKVWRPADMQSSANSERGDLHREAAVRRWQNWDVY